MSHCGKCGGLIVEPGKTYGWAGKVCYCANAGSSPAKPYIQQAPANPLMPEATQEQLIQRVKDLEKLHLYKDHQLFMLKEIYGKFEMLYTEVDSLKGMLDHQKKMYSEIIETLTKSINGKPTTKEKK